MSHIVLVKDPVIAAILHELLANKALVVVSEVLEKQVEFFETPFDFDLSSPKPLEDPQFFNHLKNKLMQNRIDRGTGSGKSYWNSVIEVIKDHLHETL